MSQEQSQRYPESFDSSENSDNSEESSSEESTIEMLPPPPRTPKKKAPAKTLKRKAPTQEDLPLQPPAKKAKPSTRPAAKHWCFTWNNPPGDDQMVYDIIKEWPTTYVVFQSEVADSGTPHIQGYVEFDKPQRLTSIRKMPLAGMFQFREATKSGKPIIIIK